MRKSKNVVILLPTYNEKDNLKKFFYQVLKQEKICKNWKFNILIIDSNSPDGTYNIAKKMAKSDPKLKVILAEKGLGKALLTGYNYTLKNYCADLILQIDADGQVDANVLPKLIETIDEGYDLAIGSRFVEGGKNLLGIHRKMFTLGASIVCRYIMGPSNIKEFCNSARAFKPELYKKMDHNLIPWDKSSFIVLPAFINAAVLAGANYKEVPLIFKDRSSGNSKMLIFTYIIDLVSYALSSRIKRIYSRLLLQKLYIDVKNTLTKQ